MALKPEADRLVETHAYLVRGTRARWFPGVPPAVAEELDGAGRCALVEAARDYDAARGSAFATLAIWRLRGAMTAERRRQQRWCRATDSLEMVERADEDALYPRLTDPAAGPLARALRRDARRALLAAVNGLPWVERDVVRRHYWQHEGMREIGLALGCGARRVMRLHEGAIEQLRERLWLVRELFGAG